MLSCVPIADPVVEYSSRCCRRIMIVKPSKKNRGSDRVALGLVVDDNQYMRKMIRNLLVNRGVKEIDEAAMALLCSM